MQVQTLSSSIDTTMSIRQRITVLVILTCLALGFVGGFAVFQSRNNSFDVKTVTEGVVPSTIASVELVGQLKDVQIATSAMVAAKDKTIVENTRNELTKTKEKLEKALKEQLAQADSEAQIGLVKLTQESLVNYFDSIEQTANFKLSGQNEMAEANMSATVDQYLREQAQMIETLQIEKKRAKDQAIESLNDTLSHTTQTLSIVTVIALLALTGMGVLLYRQITLPISRMEVKMTEIATTQDYSHRVPVKRMDEIGRSLTAFNTMVEKIEESTNLVKQKTADIAAMLHYIPQGILTVLANQKIHHEYSSYLESILETKDIAGKDFMSLIFSGTHLGADALSQIEAVSSACIGEDAMNFEFNSHLLVSEFEKTMPDGRVKIIDVSWSPITDENNTVTRLMLCLWDVTELRALAAEANAQKRELGMIGEILGVRHDKFHAFIESSKQFIEENRALIKQGSTLSDIKERNDKVVSLLFRNMHTIKGNARTYGLLNLTNEVHQAEQAYDDLRQSSEASQSNWNEAQLLEQLDTVRQRIDEYAQLNEHKLGRKGARSTDLLDAQGANQKDQVHEAMVLLETLDETNPASLKETLRKVRSSLQLIGTQKVEDVLSGVIDSLPSLAQELGKPNPKLSIESNGIVLKNQISDTIRNVFMHLYRNAIDHGLESAEKRETAGKAPVGKIDLFLSMEKNQLKMRLKDDGQGLAVRKLLDKAIEKGLVAADAKLKPEQVAQLIFAPGFSTAQKITEVSGRGVGMDAVKGFIESQGGQIELQLLPKTTDNEAEFQPFETVINLPEKFAVQI
jgi:two-component system, chemotaxis family, sensor kinase CheA